MKADGWRRDGIYRGRGVQNVENVANRLKLLFRLVSNIWYYD
jgi:hypothetical protein